MDQNETSVIVALIPQEDSWCKIESPHMTIVYVGETGDLKNTSFNELAKDVASISMLSNPILVKVMKHDVMGDDERVDVFRLSLTPELLSIWRMFQKWNNGEFVNFEPHVTIGPEGSYAPEWNNQNLTYLMYLTFDRIAVFWGKDHLNFWLRKY